MISEGPAPNSQVDKLATHEFGDDIRAILGNASVETMLETVCLATGLRFAAIARVTTERWITCSAVDYLEFGLKPGDELVVESTICHEVRQHRDEVIINDVACDVLYRDHHTPQQYGFRSYLSIPICRPDGRFFGTLCALDPEPSRLDDIRILKMVRLFAKMIGDSLQSDELLEVAREELAQERHMSEVQEHYMAILAHDLRNPITAIRSGLRMLRRRTDDSPSAELIGLMEGSATRMTGLVTNLMDHARNRLGGGIVLDRRNNGKLGDALEQIVAEFRTIAPERDIQTRIDLPISFSCDTARMAQLLSNLLGNALTHGASDRPVRVTAMIAEGAFTMSVANEGRPIPETQIPTLFTPFSSGAEQREGLGLGLYIAAEIAKAHGGRLSVISDTEATIFTLRMPIIK